jgi:hypothetical protein
MPEVTPVWPALFETGRRSPARSWRPGAAGRCIRRSTLVRLATDEVAVVTHEHPGDPFRPQVKVLLDRLGASVERPTLVNTWEADARADFPSAVVEAVDPDGVGIDPLAHL